MNLKVLKLLFVICLMSVYGVNAQITVNGVVTDGNTGAPLPGANILEKGTTNGVSSDFDGNYSISVSDSAVLVFSYVGYLTQEVSVEGQSVINVTLQEDASQLDQVVVTALGITRDRKSLSYAVSQLEGEDVALAKEANVASSLAGKVAGVVVSRSTSGPGGGTRVIIRGNASITGNNQPLYVVDGVPIDNSGISNAGTGEFVVNDLGTGISDINPDDIESMSILKGPNAAALYGSRAANGVVLITTKKGALNKGLGVTYTTSITFDTPLVLPEYQNEYGRGSDGDFPDINATDPLSTQVNAVTGTGSWGPRFDGSNQLEFNGELSPYSAQPDNVEDFFETGTTFVNTIALSGGNENSSVRFSYTNSDIESILPNSGLTRNNFNLRGFSKLTDKFTIDARVTYFLQDARNRPQQGTEGLAAYLWGLPRNISTDLLSDFQDLDNPINPNDPFRVQSPRTGTGNPYWVLLNDRNEDNRTRFSGFAKLQYDFTDWFSAFVRAGTDRINHDTERYNATGHHFYPGGRIFYGQNESTESNYDFLLMFNRDLNDKINLSANAGGNILRTTNINSGSSGEDFKIPGKYFLNNTDGDLISANQSDLIEKEVHSLYAQASVGYDDKIYLDLMGRNDWSSALAAENRSYFYSSVGISALLHNILDIDDSFIDFLKVRGSVANVGSDTGPLQIVNLFSVAGDGYLGNTQVNRPNIRFSESLRPEDTKSFEVGFEFKALKNRLYADFSYYSNSVNDLIFDVPVDPGTGFSFFRENVGEITNKGFEILVGGSPFRTEDFRWDTSFNIGVNENRLEELIDGQDLFVFSSSNGGIVDVRAQVGDGFGDIYTTTWLRNDAGELILTAEGRPQATSEREKFGNYQPDATGGFRNTFTYKNFSLNCLIDFRIGGEVFSFTDSALDATGVSERSLEFREGGVLVEGVVDNGDGTFSPNTTTISAQDYWGAVSGIGSEYVFDQTNARMRELSLTYSLPPSILENIFIQRLSLSLVGRNLFFLSKETDNFDPESSYSTNNFSQGVLFYQLPTTKSIGFSVNANF